jgi:hypothetical protein
MALEILRPQSPKVLQGGIRFLWKQWAMNEKLSQAAYGILKIEAVFPVRTVLLCEY